MTMTARVAVACAWRGAPTSAASVVTHALLSSRRSSRRAQKKAATAPRYRRRRRRDASCGAAASSSELIHHVATTATTTLHDTSWMYWTKYAFMLPVSVAGRERRDACFVPRRVQEDLMCEKPKKALKSSPPITTHFYTRNGSESAPPDTCTKWWCTSDDPVLLGVATVAMLTGIGGAALFSPIFLLGFPLLGPEYPLETATAGGRGVRPFTSTDG